MEVVTGGPTLGLPLGEDKIVVDDASFGEGCKEGDILALGQGCELGRGACK
jgi:hypothetical protein